VQRVVRQVALVEATPGVVHSGSYRDRHGFIHASAQSSVMSLAEVLVHEAAHQYFHLLCCLGPVDDGTDATQYYSPLVGKKRPLDRILFAFHACANIRNFYRLCMNNGAADVRYCRDHEPVVARQLDQLNVALRNNRTLTSVGRAIYDPLANEAA
jgi:HEXXH motif-containing protein